MGEVDDVKDRDAERGVRHKREGQLGIVSQRARQCRRQKI